MFFLLLLSMLVVLGSETSTSWRGEFCNVEYGAHCPRVRSFYGSDAERSRYKMGASSKCLGGPCGGSLQYDESYGVLM